MRSDIITEALSWVDTPYHHQAKLKGVGVDCAQLILGVAQELHYTPKDVVVTGYSREWNIHNREEVMLGYLEQFGAFEVQRPLEGGDILCFKFGRACGHLGIYLGDGTFVHSHLTAGKVLVNSLSGDLLRKHAKTYSFPLEKIR